MAPCYIDGLKCKFYKGRRRGLFCLSLTYSQYERRSAARQVLSVTELIEIPRGLGYFHRIFLLVFLAQCFVGLMADTFSALR